MTNLVKTYGDPRRLPSRLPGTDPASLDGVYFQRRNIPAPDDFTLIGQVAADRDRRLARTIAAPGFATLETLAVSTFNLILPPCNALVGDEALRLCTAEDGTGNVTTPCGAPPGSGTRWDVAFVESWVAEVGPLGTADPASKFLPAWGGRGNANLSADDRFVLQNPDVGQETARRTQLRWAIRVAQGVDLTTYPDGLGDPTILGQADAGAPLGGKPFQEVAGRTSVYRAGDGSAADAVSFANATGFTWAIPLVAILRTAGESALTLTGSVDLRRQLISRVGVSKEILIGVLPFGGFTVGTGATGEAAEWRQPHLGGAASGFYPANLTGTTNDTPLSGAFVVPLDDFDLPAGWTLSGKLYGNVFRQESGSDTGAKTYGIRVRRPGQTYGQSVKELTFTLGPVSSGDGDYKALEAQHDPFDVPSDGSAAGVWVVELYSQNAGTGIWLTGGVRLRVWAENQ